MRRDSILYHNCKLLDERGEVFVESVTIDLRFRERSIVQPDEAPVWFGNLYPQAPVSVTPGNRLKLRVPGEFEGLIQIQAAQATADASIAFHGVSESPQADLGQYLEPAATTCGECKSLFFPPASRLEGLCPECAHQLYGYENCRHTFTSGTCVKCGWDGSRSDFL